MKPVGINYTTGQKTDLIVIGTGLAGSAATAFAAACGIKTLQVGLNPGQTQFASGALDLLGIYPVSVQNRWDDPWAGIAALVNDEPEHPYSKAGLKKIREAWDSFLEILSRAGLPYCGWPEHNAALATCAGTVKTSYQVPQTMWPGVIGLKEKRTALIIDFEGMKEFSGLQMVETISPKWPQLVSQTLKLPSLFIGVDQQNYFIAEALESPRVRDKLAIAIEPFLKNVEMIGMPAVLGLHRMQEVTSDLEQKLGVPVFEIPTFPPSVPGIRLKEAIEKQALQGGAVIMHGVRAVAVESSGRRCTKVWIQAGQSRRDFEAQGVILATGRFLGGGLVAGRDGIRETLLDLPVHQPKQREGWHRENFLDPQGHPINRAGLEVDSSFRPFGPNGQAAYNNLFAVGSLLAHQDWVRMKCGAGMAIVSAYAAVRSFMNQS